MPFPIYAETQELHSKPRETSKPLVKLSKVDYWELRQKRSESIQMSSESTQMTSEDVHNRSRVVFSLFDSFGEVLHDWESETRILDSDWSRAQLPPNQPRGTVEGCKWCRVARKPSQTSIRSLTEDLKRMPDRNEPQEPLSKSGQLWWSHTIYQSVSSTKKPKNSLITLRKNHNGLRRHLQQVRASLATHCNRLEEPRETETTG